MNKIPFLSVFCLFILYSAVGQDVAFRKIHNPTSGCELRKENIVVELYNNGSDDILSAFQLNYSINGGQTVSQMVNERIPGYETITVVFDEAYDFTNNSYTNEEYNIRVWITKMDQDRQQINDTMSIAIISMGKTESPIVPNVVNVPYRTSGIVTPQLPSSVKKGVFSWYAKDRNGVMNFMEYNETFTTPEIMKDTTFYVSATPGTLSERTIGTGTVLTTDPFVFNAGYSRGRMLFTKEEIGSKGPIAAIGFYVNNVANGKDGIPIKIYLKETVLSKFDDSQVSWENEVNSATLIVDERIFFNKTGWWYFELDKPYDFSGDYNLVIITETRCNDYCSNCNGCSYDVSGGSTYPRFKATACEKGYVQVKSGNTSSLIDYGVGTSKTARLNTYFKFADVGCESEIVPVNIHVTDVPNYDVETKSLAYPLTNVCTLGNENIQVKVQNTKDTPIPADKVVVHAVINGTELSQTVTDSFKAREEKTVIFDTPFDFSAPTADNSFNYTIFTTLNDEKNVYTNNDTIAKTLISKYTAVMPDSFVYQGNYTFPFVVLPEKDRSEHISSYTYYANETISTALKSGSNVKQYVTDSLYKSFTLWITGRTQKSGCVTRRVPVHIHVMAPQYDLKTSKLVYPTNYQCGVAQNANIKVTVCNADTSSSSVIPAGTFKMSAKMTGSNAISGSSVINVPLASMKNSEISIALNNIGSATQNNIYQYTVYSDPTDPKLYVFRNNDTITGNLCVPANPSTPEAMVFAAPYGLPYQVNAYSNVLNHYYFYKNSTDKIPFAQGQGFLTEPVYGTQTYYYKGRIGDENFEETVNIGSSNITYGYPFNFSANRSFTKLYYTKDEIGGNAGMIDTIYMYVQTINESEATIPVKIWMKNCNNKTSVIENKFDKKNTWEVETGTAQLIFDGEMAFDKEGWLAIPIYGGFQYDGEGGIYLYTEHDCDCKDCSGVGCLARRGVYPLPKFYNSTMTQKVLTKTNVESVTFNAISYRLNLKFKLSHTCTSPMSTITVNTVIPSNDVEVVSIVSPVTQSSTYTATETVRAVIKNNGKSDVSNFPIVYQLDNNVVKETYTKRLAVGKTDTITFAQSLDLTGIYYGTSFKVYTDLSNDGFRSNDTVTIMLLKGQNCASYPLSAAGLDIAHVKFAGIDNASGNGSFDQFTDALHDGKYTDYTQTVAPGNIVAGRSFPIEITHAFANREFSKVSKYVYIDLNRDGIFDEKTELVFSAVDIPSTKDKAVTSGSVNIPLEISVGITRMRVLCVGDSKWSSPCGIYDNGNSKVYGETEDYTIIIDSQTATDLGISNYVHPVGDVCPDEHAIAKVIVRNYGTQKQEFSADNPIILTLNVSGAKTKTYSKVVEQGSLNPGDTLLVVFDNVDIGTKGSYTFSSKLSYEKDAYAGNDTASCCANTNKIVTYLSISDLSQNFDANNDGSDTWLPRGWSLDGSNNDYRWKNTTGHSVQYPTGGPEHDHTFANTSLQENGSYMSVSNSSSNKYVSDWTALTSGCVNLKNQEGFPVEISFYKYLYGSNSATYTLTVEVGSGNDFMVLDSITEKTDGCNTPEWVQHTVSCADFNAIGQVRFKMTGQQNVMDPSIDDIEIMAGLPDLEVKSIEYPYDFRDSIAHPDACLNVGDTIYPSAIIKNSSSLVARNYRLMCVMTSGTIRDTIVEDALNVIAPRDTLLYTFKQGFVLPDKIHRCQFFVIADIDYDSDELNNIKNVIICTTTGIDDCESNAGFSLEQNIPNPAVDMTKIPYRIPESGKAVLKVYSAMGQMLYMDMQEVFAGDNIFEVPLENFKSGIYFYTLMFEGTSLTKKMIIQK